MRGESNRLSLLDLGGQTHRRQVSQIGRKWETAKDSTCVWLIKLETQRKLQSYTRLTPHIGPYQDDTE